MAGGTASRDAGEAASVAAGLTAPLTASLADVLAPDNQEGTKATILKWCKAAGDRILKDEPLLELETDKVTVEIPSPATGELAEILKQPNEEVLPGQLLARVRIDAESGPGGGAAAAAAGAEGAPRMEQTAGDGAAPRAQAPGAGVTGMQARGVQAPGASAAPPAEDGRGRLSPAVRRMLRENALRAGDIAGSGRDGRITAQDVARRITAAPAESACRIHRFAAGWRNTWCEVCGAAPHVTTLFEADLTRVQAHRARHAADTSDAVRGSRSRLISSPRAHERWRRIRR